MITANEIYQEAILKEANAELNRSYYSAILLFVIGAPAMGCVYALVYFLFSLPV